MMAFSAYFCLALSDYQLKFFIFPVCSATALSYLLTLFTSPSSRCQKSSSPGSAICSLSWWYTPAPHYTVVFSNLVTPVSLTHHI